ncbi:MAG: ATP-binding cassette domain-containing protein [Lachnospiraceae bacterium]|nr:ATP-binding cassette domain-containing protein [Lachnospiraceae bacterium]
MIEIKNISKQYTTVNGCFTALSDISIKFPNKGLIALYGENGCGKTTLLNLISTLDTQYEGDIFYNDHNLRSITEKYRRNIVSVVLQENSFVPYLNVYDNISLFADETERTRINNRLMDFDIPEKSEENPSCLSGGQKQRVSIIRGLSKPAKVLLVDEPTSSLNEQMEKEVFETLKKQAKDKLVILVSHRISLIRQYADMIVCMDKGTIRSAEKNECPAVMYSGSQIVIPETLSGSVTLDADRIRRMMGNEDQITIRMGTETEDQFEPDFSVCSEETADRNIQFPGTLKRKSVFASLSYSKRGWIGLSVLIVVFAAFLGLLCSFSSFNKYSFAARCIRENVSGLINYKGTHISDDVLGPFDYERYEDMKNRLHSKMLIRKEFESPLCLDFEEGAFYSNIILGLAYCRTEDISIIYGQFADDSSVMITDYLADGLVCLDNDYDSYDSILTIGISIAGVHMNVQGIVDTDYEQYKTIYDSDEFTMTQRYIDYQQGQWIYKSIFLPIPSANSEKPIPFLTSGYGEELFSLRLLDQTDPYYEKVSTIENGCLVSPALFRTYSEGEYIKYLDGYLNVAGCKETEDETHAVYISPEIYASVIQSLFENIDCISIDLKNSEEEKTLEQYGMMHNTSMSGYINICVDVITVLQSIFYVLLLVLLFGIIICAVSLNGNLLSRDKHLIGFMRIAGYEKKTIFSIDLLKIAFISGAVLILSEGVFWGSVWGINSLLSHSIGYSMVLCEMNVLSVAVIIAVVVSAFSISLLQNNKCFKAQIVDLVNN